MKAVKRAHPHAKPKEIMHAAFASVVAVVEELRSQWRLTIRA